jgi:glucokinase-like ROK family protein
MTGRTRTPCAPTGSAGSLLDLIRSGDGSTRSDLAELTGLARSTISQRVDGLITAGFIVEAGEARSTGGRPPMTLQFNESLGVVLAADIGATHSRFAVCDMNAEPLAEITMDMLVADGPDSVLSTTETIFDSLLQETGWTQTDVQAVGIGVPGPVDFAAGRAENPPIMFGWHDYPIRDRISDRYDTTVLVDNDVNIMALGEYWRLDPRIEDMLFVKVGTGIGSGLILGGHLHRGARGTAGDIGHIRVNDGDVVCNCGHTGCLEGSAGGAALAQQLSDKGLDAQSSRDVMSLAIAGNQDAIAAIREAGRLLGAAVSGVVNMLNPAVIVVGGDIARTGQLLLAGVREVVYQRSTALSTSDLKIQGSRLGDRAGIIGAAALVLEHILDPEEVDAQMSAQLGATA